MLTTQLFVKGHPQNERDGVLRALKDEKALAAVMGDFQPVPNSKIGELAVNFDVVLGQTPQENRSDDGQLIFGVGKSDRESRSGDRRPR